MFGNNLPNLVCMAMVVLLPIVPAYLLFRLLPESDGWIGGMFQGMEFKFSGAFAGYLLVMWVAYTYLPPSDSVIWTVRGEVELEALEDQRILDKIVEVTLEPDLELRAGSNMLEFSIVRPVSVHLLPIMRISADGYAGDAIDLATKADPYTFTIDFKKIVLYPDDDKYETTASEATRKNEGGLL